MDNAEGKVWSSEVSEKNFNFLELLYQPTTAYVVPETEPEIKIFMWTSLLRVNRTVNLLIPDARVVLP